MRTVRYSGRLSCHTYPPQPCTPPCHVPPFTMHPFAAHPPLACTRFCHACPTLHHACPTLHHACPPPPDRMTDACENITFPRLLLRMVKTPIVEITGVWKHHGHDNWESNATVVLPLNYLLCAMRKYYFSLISHCTSNGIRMNVGERGQGMILPVEKSFDDGKTLEKELAKIITV